MLGRSRRIPSGCFVRRRARREIRRQRRGFGKCLRCLINSASAPSLLPPLHQILQTGRRERRLGIAEGIADDDIVVACEERVRHHGAEPRSAGDGQKMRLALRSRDIVKDRVRDVWRPHQHRFGNRDLVVARQLLDDLGRCIRDWARRRERPSYPLPGAGGENPRGRERVHLFSFALARSEPKRSRPVLLGNLPGGKTR